MKVIFVIVSMAGGGAERVISILANQFVSRGVEVTILMTAGDEVAYVLDERVHIVSAGGVSGGSFLLRFKRIMRMRQVLKEKRDAAVISFGPGTSFFAVVAGMFLGHSFLVSERNDPAACPHPGMRNFIYQRAERIIFQTQDAVQCFPKKLRKKGAIIANPIKKGLPDRYIGERERRIVCVGRLEPQKNHMLLLEAFAGFTIKYPKYTLHLYGDGSLRKQLADQAAALNVEDKVIFEGFTKDIIQEIYKSAMYVLSSDYEGISNSLLEAMAIGLPVISTDCPIGGSRMCITPYENGILVKTADVHALKEAMERIAGDPQLAQKLGTNAAKIREQYAEERISEQWMQIIKDIGYR